MKVILYTNEYKKRWDDFITTQSDGSFHHLIGWKSILEDVFHYESYYLMAIDDEGRLRGVLPLCLIKDILQRRFLISIPFLNYAGILAQDEVSESSLLSKAIAIAKELNIQYLQIKQLARRFDNLKGTDAHVTMFLKLNESAENVWQNSLKAKTRNQVRKSQKYGLHVLFSKDCFDQFYEIYTINMRRLGTPVLPRKYFSRILEFFPMNTDILTIWKENKAIAGMFIFKYKSIISDPWASSLWEYNKYCPNNLMYWEAIQYGCNNGFEFFDMGRSTINTGTFNFKKQWGAEPLRLAYQYYLNRKKELPLVDAVNNKYVTAIQIWKKIPLRLANAIGPKLVKYLPEY